VGQELPKLEDHGVDLTAAGIRVVYVDGTEGQNLRMVETAGRSWRDGKFLVSVAAMPPRFSTNAQLRLLSRRHVTARCRSCWC